MVTPIGRVQVDALYDQDGNPVTLPIVIIPASARIVVDATLIAPATTYDIPGLDGNAAFGYTLFIVGLNSSGLGMDLFLYVNADYTAANYYSERVIGAAAIASAAITNYPSAGTMVNNEIYSVRAEFLPIALQRQRIHSSCVSSLTTGRTDRAGIQYIQNVANLTDIRLLTTQANGLGIGTRILLIKNIW